MSNENEQSASSWEDENEPGTSFRDSYLSQNRPQPRSGSDSQNTPDTSGRRPRPRGVPGSADFYEEVESNERATRPRPTRQSREEVEARLRQRARQPIYAREQEERRSKPAAQARQQAPRTSQRGAEEIADYPRQPGAARQARPTRDFAQDVPRTTRDFSSGRSPRYIEQPDDYDDIEIIEEFPPTRKGQHKHRRGRGVFSTLLTGCLGGLLTLIVVAGVVVFLILHNTPLGQNLGIGKSTFNQSAQQTLNLGAATQLIVKDQAGNLTINVDPNANSATLNSVKHVLASSQSDANTQFKQIVLSVKPITQDVDASCLVSSCLLINATTPASPGGLFGGSNGTTIDLTLTLPASFNSSNPDTPGVLTANASAGNISISGFNGVLNLSGKAGNINVAHSLIFAGTCIQTLHGNITIAQASIFDLATPSRFVPCNNSVSSDPQRPWFNIKSGVGDVNITLATNLNNLLLDANTNSGKITDDFNLNITSNDDSDTYHGPIVPNTHPTASLYVATSTGNIMLHKQ